jgi:hypothetical protein
MCASHFLLFFKANISWCSLDERRISKKTLSKDFNIINNMKKEVGSINHALIPNRALLICPDMLMLPEKMFNEGKKHRISDRKALVLPELSLNIL